MPGTGGEAGNNREDKKTATARKGKKQNDHLKKQGIYLEPVRWEHFLDAMSKTRLPDEYNRALRDYDIVVSLFKTKVGKFTEEEFDVAWANFQATDKPGIFTFFRDFQLSGDTPQAAIPVLRFLCVFLWPAKLRLRVLVFLATKRHKIHKKEQTQTTACFGNEGTSKLPQSYCFLFFRGYSPRVRRL